MEATSATGIFKNLKRNTIGQVCYKGIR